MISNKSFSRSVFLFTAVVPAFLQAQVNNGDKIDIPSGSYMNVQMDLNNNSSGIINNAGHILLTGDYTNDGAFNSAANSYVNLEGGAQSIGGTNSTTFSNLVIDGSSDKTCNINTYVNEDLLFNNNKVIIGSNDLTILTPATITGSDNSKYVVTNGTGSLVKSSVPLSADFLFPVGDATNSYKPVTLNYSGTLDTFAVRVAAGVQPSTGADNECVEYTYFVEETNSGGSSASLKLGWDVADEGILFGRTLAEMWQYSSGAWGALAGTAGAISNLPATDWYYKTGGITDFSSGANRFIVKSSPVDNETDLFIPEAFSPNNDGQNDVLFVRGKGIKDLEFIIYDRWDEKVFESKSLSEGWDGTYKGEKLSTAVFVYYVKVTYTNDTEESRKGNVTLVR